MTLKIEVVVADITSRVVDAIVNAANKELIAGGGVCGAIHRAAGTQALETEARSRYPEGCPTGQAVETSAHNLSAKYVIHTVGPVWHGGEHGEAELLASAYKNSLLLADQLGCVSIAFPNISTGIYGYPMEEASYVAARAVAEVVDRLEHIKSIEICCFDTAAKDIYSQAFSN
jgi:O-acetyl-ADP-ribose deacetylase (regulator of RNase III)